MKEEYSSSSLEDSEDEYNPYKKSRLDSSGSESSDDGEMKEKSSELQKMEFSEVLEIDGIWRSGPHFGNFRKKEMETVVRLGARTITDASKFVLPKFEKPGSKFASFDVSDGIFNDCLKWSRKEKGKPVVKPRKRTVSLAGEKFEVTSFCSPLCSSFKKFTLQNPNDKTLHVVYVSTSARHFYDDLMNMKNNRISDCLSKKVREALAGQTIKSVFENLKKVHPELSEKQVRNLARTVPDCVKKNRGLVPVTVPEVLAQLQTTTRDSYFNSKGKDFEFVYVDKDMMSIYVKSLPTRINIQDYKSTLDQSEKWSVDDINSFIDYHSKNSNSGTINKMSGQLQIDCTFDLSDCVVTIISCDLTGFLTRSSTKTRHCCLAFMISSSKKRECHKFFADCLHQEFLNVDPRLQKGVPVVVTDSESALSEYTNIRASRCAVHRRDNLTREMLVSDSEVRT
ncbi:hypothetical protein CRE_12445, partial [Caenorhabditis remanei]